MQKIVPQKNEKGFTLIEMLVSITLFSIVLVVILGSIITIIDVNRKSRSLTIVMNDVNFAMESFTRSIKTGQIHSEFLDINPNRISYNQIKVVDQNNREITYKFVEGSGNDLGRIDRSLKLPNGSTETIALTSSQINVTNAEFTVFYGSKYNQPRVLMLMTGEVQTSPTISSEFSIQTSVSPRKIDSYYSSLYQAEQND